MNQYLKQFSIYLTFGLIVTLSSFLLWLPFFSKSSSWFGLEIPNSSCQYVYRNYDGPLYIIVAKTFYSPFLINNLHLELNLSPNYFAAHLPFYPFFIRIFSYAVDYLRAMIFVNLFFTFCLAALFYYLLKNLSLTKKPFLLTTVLLFLPRFWVVRSIGAPESLFMFLVLLSLFSFEKKNYLLAGLFGGLATITKTPGILLFPVYLLASGETFIKLKKFSWKNIFLCLIPLSLVGVFLLYAKQYGNFWAYFNSESFVPLVFPFSVFNFQKVWVGTAWLEEIIFYFFLYLLTVITLWRSKQRSFFYFSLIFFVATTFVQHRDISRYSLPLWPLACIAFENFFTSKKFVLALIILLPAIWLYAINFLTYNILPISNWQAFL